MNIQHIATQPSRRRFLTSSAKLLGGAAALMTLGDSLIAPDTAAAAPAVPWPYQPLADELNQRIDAAAWRLLNTQSAPAMPHTYGAHLFSADANRVTALLDTWSFVGCQKHLDAMQALGVNAVTVSVSYPLLDPSFANSVRYLDFYARLAAEIKRRGMTLAIQSGIVMSDAAYGTGVNYRGLSVDSYFASRSAHVQAIAQYMAPTYLTFANEPDVEQQQVGVSFDAARYTRFINETLARVPRGAIQYCGGAGSWGDLAYWNSFMANTSLDNGDLHIYPLTNGHTDYIQRAAEMVDTARARGKGCIISETSLHKAGAAEIAGQLPPPQIFQRDIFDFWQPLDSKFLYLIKLFSERKGIKYASFFWSKFLHQAYVPCTAETINYGYAQGMAVTSAAAAVSINNKTFSETGLAFAAMARGLA